MDKLEEEVKKLIKGNLIKSSFELEKAKRKIAEKIKIPNPSNADLLKAYHNLVLNKSIKKNDVFALILRKRKIRSLSGIVVVSVLTKPYDCPGKCLYCPKEEGIPKSYLSKEPAVMRAIINKFDPYLQTKNRIKALEANGHPTDKVDLRIIGGTWSYYPRAYQKWFVIRCFQACNEMDASQISNLQFSIYNKFSRTKFSNLLEIEQKKNEKAKHRMIGITVETRPDYITKDEIKRLRELGVTRVELGIQSIYDDILKLNRRGHLIKETIEATKLLKDAGFKICYQMMPNLPGSNIKKDKQMFLELFSNPDFQPDLLKIYPCAVLKEAPLYRNIKKLKHKAYTKEQLIELIKFIKANVPYYVRIQRIIRDIPSEKIALGPKNISNLRQVILWDIKDEGWRCNCIRCREVKENYIPDEKLYLFKQEYDSSGGKEIFLSYESKNRERLYSLLRLRIANDTAMIRELHTYGQMTPVGKRDSGSQHKGLGKKLMLEAENIAKKYKLATISVISGIGVRPYYKKLGYKLKDTYMVKQLT
jgi:elongator complex protein 3